MGILWIYSRTKLMFLATFAPCWFPLAHFYRFLTDWISRKKHRNRCRDVLKNPVDIGCPAQHHFCRQCIIAYAKEIPLNTLLTCPSCRAQIRGIQRNDANQQNWKNTLSSLHFSEGKVNQFMKRVIFELNTTCQNGHASTPHHRCKYTGENRLFFPPPFFFQNKNIKTKKNTEGPLSGLLEHKKRCEWVIIPCPNGETVCANIYRIYTTDHNTKCPGFPLPCGNHNCGIHLSLFFFSAPCSLPSPFFSCADRLVPRRELRRHQTSECPFRLVNCTLLCGLRVRWNALSTHKTTQCIERRVTCPYQKYGCRVIVKAREYDSHVESNKVKHLSAKCDFLESRKNKKCCAIPRCSFFKTRNGKKRCA